MSLESTASPNAGDHSPDVRHDQVTTFLGSMRCAPCIKNNHQCLIRETDEECVLCAANKESCVFKRSVVRTGRRGDYSWEELTGSHGLPHKDPSETKSPPEYSTFINRNKVSEAHIGSEDVSSAISTLNPVSNPGGIENRREHTNTNDTILPEPDTGASNGGVGPSEMLPGDQAFNLLDGPKALSTTDPDEFVVCSECGCSFRGTSRYTNLRRHKSTQHENVPRIHCTFPGCYATFARADNLDRHMQQQHNSSIITPDVVKACGNEDHDLIERASFLHPNYNPMYVGLGALPTLPASANPVAPGEPKMTASLLAPTTTLPNQSTAQVQTTSKPRRFMGKRSRPLSPKSRAHAKTVRQHGGACDSCRIRKTKCVHRVPEWLPVDIAEYKPLTPNHNCLSPMNPLKDRQSTSPSPVGEITVPKDNVPAPTVTKDNVPAPIDFHVYGNCIDPESHFHRASGRLFGVNGQPERFTVERGSCSICGDG